MAVQANVPFAPVRAFDRDPIDEIGVAGAAKPCQQRDPPCEKIGAPADCATRAFDPRAGRAVEPVRSVLDECFEPQAQPDQRFALNPRSRTKPDLIDVSELQKN